LAARQGRTGTRRHAPLRPPQNLQAVGEVHLHTPDTQDHPTPLSAAQLTHSAPQQAFVFPTQTPPLRM